MKILSDEEICKAVCSEERVEMCPYNTTLVSGMCSPWHSLKAIARAQAAECAKWVMENLVEIRVDDEFVGYELDLTPEEYAVLKELGEHLPSRGERG